MSSATVSTIVSTFKKDVVPKESTLRDVYNLEKCERHLAKCAVLPTAPWKLFNQELVNYSPAQINHSIVTPSRFFQIATYGCNGSTDIDRICRAPAVPLLFFVSKGAIRVEIARANCLCRHVFTVSPDAFYEIVKDSRVHALDIEVAESGAEMFEFLAFTLPGTWLRELRALNVFFNGECLVEALGSLLKKSRNLGHLRVGQTGAKYVKVSDLIGTLNGLETLELHAPAGKSAGFLFDNKALDVISELQKRKDQKPFRSLKAFNTSFAVITAEDFMRFCRGLSHLEHNKKFEGFEELMEIQGRGGFDFVEDEAVIKFEVTPRFPRILQDSLMREMRKRSESWMVKNLHSDKPTSRSFLMRGCLFHLMDRD